MFQSLNRLFEKVWKRSPALVTAISIVMFVVAVGVTVWAIKHEIWEAKALYAESLSVETCPLGSKMVTILDAFKGNYTDRDNYHEFRMDSRYEEHDPYGLNLRVSGFDTVPRTIYLSEKRKTEISALNLGPYNGRKMQLCLAPDENEIPPQKVVGVIRPPAEHEGDAR